MEFIYQLSCLFSYLTRYYGLTLWVGWIGIMGLSRGCLHLFVSILVILVSIENITTIWNGRTLLPGIMIIASHGIYLPTFLLIFIFKPV